MTDLLTRLGQATEGSRELDARLCAVEENRTITHDDQGRMLGRHNDPPHDCCILFWEGGPDYKYVPRYTTSLEAALTLVPEGWRWEVRGGDRSPRAGVYETTLQQIEDGATPALALCIAALRARG